MAFKEVQSLECETVVSLGGKNKKTGKANPTQIEGYYLGSKSVVNNRNKDKPSFIHVFQTQEGNVGIWGKTDSDRKMASILPGSMTRVSFSGMRDTPNGPMYTYKVEVDKENTIQVDLADQATPPASEGGDSDWVEEEYQPEEVEEPTAAVYAKPKLAAAATLHTPDKSQQARVQALLGKSRTA